MKKQSGFTLIELMIVVAIIGILAAIALPAYQNYTNKAKFSEVVMATSAVKSAFEIAFAENGTLASAAADTAVSQAAADANVGQYVNQVQVTSAGITASAISGQGLGGNTYVLEAAVANSAVQWTVSGSCTSNGWC